jgi:hypothetical protein
MAKDDTLFLLEIACLSGGKHVVSSGETPLHKAQCGFLKTCDRTVLLSLALDCVVVSVT